MTTFREFCEVATGRTPLPFQVRLACGAGDETEGAVCESQVVDVPPGCGRVTACLLAWLWNRVWLNGEDWPRRAIVCLPQHTWLEPTARRMRFWLENLEASEEMWPERGAGRKVLRELLRYSPVLLQPEADARAEVGAWEAAPEAVSVVLGNRDLLVSRALHRGAGMSRFRWPVQFGLLNNDALWIVEGADIAGPVTAVTAQLQGLRERLGHQGPTATWWLGGADAAQSAMACRDFAAGRREVTVVGGERDLDRPEVARRYRVARSLSRARVGVTQMNAAALRRYTRDLAKFVGEVHRPGERTLVILNATSRAQALLGELRNSPLVRGEPLALIHSQFQPRHLREPGRMVLPFRGGIAVAAFGLEGCAPLEADRVMTELAPWPHLLLRWAHLREAEGGREPEALWIDVATPARDDRAARVWAPFTGEQLAEARSRLEGMTHLILGEVARAAVPWEPCVVPRAKDVGELFETAPESEAAWDVSAWTTSFGEPDAFAFWSDDEAAVPHADALCRVPARELTEYVKKHGPAFRWCEMTGAWRSVGEVRAGELVRLPVRGGGYSAALGWTGHPNDVPAPESVGSGGRWDWHDADWEAAGRELELKRELAGASKAAEELTYDLKLGREETAALRTAAAWFDVGKAHPAFQARLGNGGEGLRARGELAPPDPARRGFRFEVASVVMWWMWSNDEVPHRDLAAFLIGSQRGRVGISIGPVAEEEGTGREERPGLFARGVWHWDQVPADGAARVCLPDGRELPVLRLDLRPIRLEDEAGTGTWSGRMLRLVDAWGPYRLGLFEAVLRASIRRAEREVDLL